MSDSEKQLADGVLIELPRDLAKAFFGCRDESSVREFLETRLDDDQTNQVAFSGAWQLLAKCFGDGTLEVGSGEPPLSWCFLGGRPMPAGDGQTVNLLRPDMVGHIATKIGELEVTTWLAEQAQQLGMEATPEQIEQAATHVQAIQVFCDGAAKNGSAAVFAADSAN